MNAITRNLLNVDANAQLMTLFQSTPSDLFDQLFVSLLEKGMNTEDDKQVDEESIGVPLTCSPQLETQLMKGEETHAVATNEDAVKVVRDEYALKQEVWLHDSPDQQTIEIEKELSRIFSKAPEMTETEKMFSKVTLNKDSLKEIDGNQIKDFQYEKKMGLETIPLDYKLSQQQSSGSVPDAKRVFKPVDLINQEKVSNEFFEMRRSLIDGEEHRVTVKLTPESLGDVELKLTLQDGKINGVIQVSNPEARQQINEVLQNIKGQLQSQNVQVGSLDVNLGNQQSFQEQKRNFSQNVYESKEEKEKRVEAMNESGSLNIWL